MKEEGSIYRPRCRGMDGPDEGLIKAYGGLGFPKREHMDCASLEPIRG